MRYRMKLERSALAAIAPAAVVAAHIHPELPWGSLALDPGVDYELIARRARLVLDLRGVTRASSTANVVRL